MPFIIGGLAAGGSILSGIIGAGAANKAASQSAAAQDRATQATNARFAEIEQSLAPFVANAYSLVPTASNLALSGPTGGGPDYVGQAANYLERASGMLPGQMTEAELQATPGYQFTLDQSLKAIQNSAAARGLGTSGAAMKGAAAYATGLADSTYKDQFNIQQQRFQNMVGLSGNALGLNTAQQGNITNQFNRLNSLINTGENAAAQTGVAGTSLANTAAQTIAGAGGAEAAGTVGGANALSSGISGVGNSLLNAQFLNRSGGSGGPTLAQQLSGLFGSGSTGGFASTGGVDPSTLDQTGLTGFQQV